MSNDPNFLLKDDLLHVIKNTNIVSTDLIIFDEQKRVLVGKRKNNPAIGTYFVPGSRVLKGYTIQQAVNRCCDYELGMVLDNPTFSGVYEHIYDTNFDNKDFGTHYVVFAYEYHVDNTTKQLINESKFTDQHSEYLWIRVSDLMSRNDVHDNCKAHFMYNPLNKIC